MRTTRAGAYAVGSYRLVHAELARRLNAPLDRVHFTWQTTHFDNQFDLESPALTRNAFVQIGTEFSSEGSKMANAFLEALGHPLSHNLIPLIDDDGRDRRTGIQVEFAINDWMLDQLGDTQISAHARLALHAQRKEDAEMLKNLQPHPISGWRTCPLDFRHEYLGLVEAVLRSENPDLEHLCLRGQVHYGDQDRMCFIEVWGCDEDTPRRRAIRAKAGEMLGLLGIVVKNEGRDIFDIEPKRPKSSHEALRFIDKFRKMTGANGAGSKPKSADG